MDSTAARGRRVALVVGNSRYRHAPLPNTSRDAEAVALALGRLGFASVKLFCDLPQSKFSAALADFGEDAEGAEVAMIYYAGHGMDVDGETFLLPVDAQPSHVRRLKFETQQLAGVISAVSGAKALGLVVLDACRNTPLRAQIKGIEATRSAVQGLSRIEPPGNILVAYAARHGTVARDGARDEHSPFTRAFLEFLSLPNVDVRLLFGKIRDAVFERTEGAQEPHLYGSLGGREVFLNDASAPQAAFNIFISYARRDEERVGMLARALQTKGWNVFWDQDLLPGPNWREMIERRLRTAHCVVAVWSKSSIESPWVTFEATRGMEKDILVPVSIDGTPPTKVFDLLQTLDLKDWNGRTDDARIAKLLRGIEDVLARAEEPNSVALPPPPPYPRPPTLGFWRLVAIATCAALISSGLVTGIVVLHKAEPQVVEKQVVVEKEKTVFIERPAPPPPPVIVERPGKPQEEAQLTPPPPVPAPPSARPLIETASVAGDYLAVVSSPRLKRNADQIALDVRARASAHLRGKTVEVQEKHLTDGIHYRVVIEPATILSEAKAICNRLKDLDFEDCFVVEKE